ncbi:hypothetical protein D9M68_607040 [compost metagenome]
MVLWKAEVVALLKVEIDISNTRKFGLLSAIIKLSTSLGTMIFANSLLVLKLSLLR